MPVPAEYDLSLELDHLAVTINASQMWRAVCQDADSDWPTVKALADAGTASQAGGLARIHQDRYDPGGVEDRPFSLIRHLNETDIEQSGTSGWDTTGQLMWFLEIPVPAAYAASIEDAGIYFRNVVGRILSEMQDAVDATPAGLLMIARFSRGPLGQIDPDEINGLNVWSVDFVVHHLG